MASDLLSPQPSMGKRPFKICEIGKDAGNIEGGRNEVRRDRT